MFFSRAELKRRRRASKSNSAAASPKGAARIECTSEQDAREAAQAGADVLMLDNYSGEQVRLPSFPTFPPAPTVPTPCYLRVPFLASPPSPPTHHRS